uniref:FAD-binding domain-containing protein n=1 Tax=Fagus sylvatica TaxID=28930 RepID=A0A2N9HRJ2_FAGSY
MEEEDHEVVIVGAGIAGLATAVALKRVGVRALVLEKSEGLRATGAALTLQGNITSLDTGASQKVNFPKSDKHGIRAIHRKALLEALAEELPEDTIRYSSKLKSVVNQAEDGSSYAVIHMENGASIKAKALVGCDGVHSVVARWLGLTTPVDSGRWAVRGLAIFPEGHGLNHEAQQFVTIGKRAGLVPLNDKEFYWFLTIKFSSKGEEMPHDPELIKRQVLEIFAKEFPKSFLNIVQHSDLSTLTWAPLMFRFPWDIIFGKVSKGNITVAGDAMHPMTPDLGQGGCSALEDAVVLGKHIGDLIIRHKKLVAGDQMAEALERYVKERRWRAAGLITSSYLAGWVQQDGSGWLMRFLRDKTHGNPKPTATPWQTNPNPRQTNPKTHGKPKPTAHHLAEIQNPRPTSNPRQTGDPRDEEPTPNPRPTAPPPRRDQNPRPTSNPRQTGDPRDEDPRQTQDPQLHHHAETKTQAHHVDIDSSVGAALKAYKLVLRVAQPTTCGSLNGLDSQFPFNPNKLIEILIITNHELFGKPRKHMVLKLSKVRETIWRIGRL